jgi:predicted nucleic acid-binding protein
MDTRYLLDSNIIIYFLEGILPETASDFVNKTIIIPQVSIISKIEILSWTPPTESNSLAIQHFLQESNVHLLDDSIVDKTIELRKKYKRVKLPDAIIAATALVKRFTLITRNENDFKSIQGLAWVNPFTP